jgi:hypothetical protein
MHLQCYAPAWQPVNSGQYTREAAYLAQIKGKPCSMSSPVGALNGICWEETSGDQHIKCSNKFP